MGRTLYYFLDRWTLGKVRQSGAEVAQEDNWQPAFWRRSAAIRLVRPIFTFDNNSAAIVRRDGTIGSGCCVVVDRGGLGLGFFGGERSEVNIPQHSGD